MPYARADESIDGSSDDADSIHSRDLWHPGAGEQSVLLVLPSFLPCVWVLGHDGAGHVLWAAVLAAGDCRGRERKRWRRSETLTNEGM